MACQSYSIRWSSSLTTICAGGGTSATFSVNQAGSSPAVGETFAGNATCSSSPNFGGANPVYIKIDGVPSLSSVVYTVAGVNNIPTYFVGQILSIGTCPSPTPTYTPTKTKTPTPTPTYTKTPTQTKTPTPTYTPTNTLTPTITPSITPSALPACTGNVVWQTIGNLSAVNLYPLTGDTYIFTTGQTYTISQTIPAGIYSAGIIDGIELPQYYTCLDCTTTTNPPYYNVYYNQYQGITTFNFSPPIENPLLAFYSLGSSSTNQTFSADTTFARYPYCNPVMPTCGTANPTEAIYDFSLNTISGYEAFGSVYFPGTHSSISIQTLGSEYRTNFLWGKSCDYEVVLEEPGTGYVDITYSSCTDGSVYRFQYLSANTLNYSGLTIHTGPYEDCYYRATPPFASVTQVDILPGLYDYEYNTDCSTCAIAYVYLSGCCNNNVYRVVESSWSMATTGTWDISGDSNIPDGCYTFISPASYVNTVTFDGSTTGPIAGGCAATECSCFDTETWEMEACCDPSDTIIVDVNVPQAPNVYVFYDATSLGSAVASEASESIRTWFATQQTAGEVAELYEGVIGKPNNNGENWLWWLNYPYLGSLTGGTLSDSTTVTEINQEVQYALYDTDHCSGQGSGGWCIPRTVKFNDSQDIYQRINRGYQLTGTYGTNDTRTNGVPFNHADLTGTDVSGPGTFNGGDTNYIVINVVDEADGTVGLYHGSFSALGTETNPFALYGPGWNGGVNPNALYDTSERFEYDYEQYLKVWEDIKIQNGRVNALVYPVITGTTTAALNNKIPMIPQSVGVVEGETLTTSEYLARYGENMDDVGPENLNLTAFTYTNIYSGFTGLTAYQNLDSEYKNGPGLKNFGVAVDPSVTGFTASFVATKLNEFLASTDLSQGLGYTYNGTCYTFTELSAGSPIITIDYSALTENICDTGACICPSPTPTPTMTQTKTPTYTPTNTNTPTYTPTNTITNTPTYTPTNTPTYTSTITPTSTAGSSSTPTPTVTQTPTYTPTNTPTYTPTITPTATAGSSSTPTATVTQTPTYTPTYTSTITPTATAGSSSTPTPTVTQTPTYTPTATVTNTPTPTDDPSPTPTATVTQTITPTVTITPTITQSGGATPTPTVTMTLTPSSTETAGNCVEAVTDGTYYYTDCCGFYRAGQSVGDLITVDTTEPYGGLSINGTPATQDCDEGDLDYSFSLTGTCGGSTNGSLTISPVGGVPPYTIDNILPGTLAGGTSNQPFTWTGLSAGTYTFRLNDSLGDSNSELYINVNIDGCLTAVIDDYSGTTCGNENGYISISGDSTSLPYLIYLYQDGGVYDIQSSNVNPTVYENLPNGDYYATVEDYGGASAQTQTVTISGVSSLDFGLAVTGTSACGFSEGAISVTGLTGTAPYTYFWSNGSTGDTITGLTVNTYSVTITDATGCQLTKSAQITTAGGIDLLAYSVTPTACLTSDGEVTVFISGGTAPYTYVGSNGQTGNTSNTTFTFTGVSSGSFTVTINDAYNCQLIEVIDVPSEGGIDSVSLSTIQTNCGNDATLNITIQGNGAPFTYSYTGQTNGSSSTITKNGKTHQFTGLSADTYDVRVESADGCCYNTTVTVTTNPKFSIDLSTSGETCGLNNGAVTITVNSGYTGVLDYVLSDGQQIIDYGFSAYTFTNLDTGLYSVTVTDAENCSVSQNFNITGTTGVIVSLTKTECTPSTNASIVANVIQGVSPYTYLWSDGQTGSTATGLTAGEYSVTVTDAQGCEGSDSVEVFCTNQSVGGYQLVTVCEDTFTTSYTKRSIHKMLNDGYLTLVADLGASGCTLNSAVFNCLVDFSGNTYNDSFYTGYTLNDVPSDQLWGDTVESVLTGITGIAAVNVDVINNTIVITGECASKESLTVNLKIDYDLTCSAVSNCELVVSGSAQNILTPTPTVTSTPGPTPDFTVTPFGTTPTPTITPTQSGSPLPTPTPTITQTQTATVTPTGSPLPTQTITPTITSTNTPTFTPTQTNTPTVTQTQTNTPTFTPTQTNTPTQTITPTYTPTFTPTPTNTPTLTQTPTPTPVFSEAAATNGQFSIYVEDYDTEEIVQPIVIDVSSNYSAPAGTYYYRYYPIPEGEKRNVYIQQHSGTLIPYASFVIYNQDGNVVTDSPDNTGQPFGSGLYGMSAFNTGWGNTASGFIDNKYGTDVTPLLNHPNEMVQTALNTDSEKFIIGRPTSPPLNSSYVYNGKTTRLWINESGAGGAIGVNLVSLPNGLTPPTTLAELQTPYNP